MEIWRENQLKQESCESCDIEPIVTVHKCDAQVLWDVWTIWTIVNDCEQAANIRGILKRNLTVQKK